MGKKDDAAKAAEAMKDQQDAVRKTENQINRGSHVCGCGSSFGSSLLLDLHMLGCEDN